jgi:N-acyl-L-homoserine lactone synthetase
MTHTIPDTLKELHQIREQLYKEERHLSPRERIARTHRTAEALLKEWGLKLKRISPPASTIKK